MFISVTASAQRARWLGALLVLLVSSLLMLPALPAGAQEEPHALIRFWLVTEADQEFFAAQQHRLDVVGGRLGRWADLVVPRSEVEAWLSRGSRVEVLHDDLEAFYAARNEYRDNFGAYHTFSEAVAWMDNLAAEYPEIVSAKWSLGLSHEGNDIWCLRVSDNPAVDEAGESEILFDALHHAREVMSSEMVLMLTEYLAAQYRAGDPEIVQLLDENEVYMVPMVNPDGFLYNELNNPGGGGMWRKNRRFNGDGTYGVDCNRNYPYEWGCDWGSSGIPGDDTYRGPLPGSEPEVQAIMQLVNDHDFVVRQSFHTYSELTLYPWGYTTADTPDHAIFVELAATMVQYNGYTPGQPGEVLYEVCGGNIDWDYGQQDAHNKIFGFSNEIGDSFDGFWPPDSRRQPLFEDNLWPSLYLIAVANDLRGPQFTHVPVPFQAPPAGPQPVTVQVQGFAETPIDPASVMLSWRLDGGSFVDLPLLPTGTPNEFGGTLPAIPGSTGVVEYYIAASDVDGRAGTAPRGAPDALYTYEIGTEFTHPMEADRGWSAGAADDDASTGLWVRVDPVATSAQPEDDHSTEGTHCWITGQHLAGETAGFNDVDAGKTTLFSPVYDLSGGEQVTVRYWRWYSNDQGNNPGSDWWDVDVSNDGGATWTAVEHTQTSSNAWVEQQFDLASYFPEPGLVQLRFVASDEGSGSLVEGGVDDFVIAGVFGVTALGNTPDALRVDLAPPVPNPFNPLTNIRFRLPAAGQVQVGIFDLRGRLLKSLVRDALPAGEHVVTWNGLDALGRPVASGTYFCKLRAPDGSELSRKLMLAK